MSNIDESKYHMGDIPGFYYSYECIHNNRYENKGVLTCKDCGMTYNENTLEWE